MLLRLTYRVDEYQEYAMPESDEEASTMREQTPLLSLRMKPIEDPSCQEDYDCVLEILAAMMSKEADYRCGDYLARHNPKAYDDSIDSPVPFVGSFDESDEAIDMVCREKMCEWSYRVCDYFNIRREVASVAFSYLDRFVDSCTCDRATFKLASMTSVYMATKVCNVRQICIDHISELSRGEFNPCEVAEMEKRILQTLEWRMNPPTIQAFIDRLCRLVPLDDSILVKGIYQRAIFFAELCLFDYTFVTEERYIVAVACILNAIEGMEHAILYQDLPSEFLARVSYSFCVDMDGNALDEMQDRLLFLFACSSQYSAQDDSILSIQKRPTQRKRASWSSVTSLSPRVV